MLTSSSGQSAVLADTSPVALLSVAGLVVLVTLLLLTALAWWRYSPTIRRLHSDSGDVAKAGRRPYSPGSAVIVDHRGTTQRMR